MGRDRARIRVPPQDPGRCPLTLRWKVGLLGGSVLLVAMLIGAVLFQVMVDPPIREREVERLARDLEIAERLFADHVSTDPAEPIPEAARLLDARITLVAADGTVLADTGVPDGDVTGMENHASRPEVVRALQGEQVLLERRSPTAGVPSLYAAVRVGPDEAPFVLRLARPLSGFPAPGRRGVFLMAGLTLAGLLAIAVGSRGVVRTIERDIGAIARGVRRMSDGDFRAGTAPEPQAPELFEVSAALRELSEEVRGRLREMQGQRDEMQTLIDSIAEGVVALTPDARVLRMNRAAAGLLDISAPPAFAPIGTLVRHPQLREHLEEAVLMPLAPRELMLGDRNLLISTHLLPGGGAVVTFLDVTELRRMEQIRRDFVANASHELKTPLTAMRGFAETLLEGDPPDDLKKQFLSLIRLNTVRLQHLVDDLLDLSRLESGAWQTLEEEVEVAALAAEVWDDLSGHQGERDLDFRVEGEAVALADGQALEQIFRNLLDNAIRFTPDGGRVRVRIEERGPELRVAVSDSGSGIPSSVLPRIFERFYRVDPGRDRAAGGTGLGLAIVRHLVNCMGGEVSAESELGRGTTIAFTLPRADAD